MSEPQTPPKVRKPKGKGKSKAAKKNGDEACAADDDGGGKENFEVGQRVLFVSEQRPERGTVRFRGPTNFAPGEWFGVELDRAIGKNDGSVKGVTYFACPPAHGVFCKRARLRNLQGRMTEGERSMLVEGSEDGGEIEVNDNNECDNECDDGEEEVVACLSGRRMELLERVWDRADQDADGALSFEEYARCMRALMEETSDPDMRASYSSVIEGATALDFEAFVHLCGPEYFDTSDEQLEHAFKLLGPILRSLKAGPWYVYTGSAHEPSYKVTMTWTVHVWIHWHRTMSSVPLNLDALRADTGTCRAVRENLQPGELRADMEWQPCQSRWRPTLQGSVPVFGVSWNISRQLGVIDGYLRKLQLATGETCGAGLAGEEVAEVVRTRAEQLGLGAVSVSAAPNVPGAYIVERQEELPEAMPDPCLAPEEDLAEWLPKLVEENPDVEDLCVNMARWHLAQRMRKEYLPRLPRPNCGNDLPFYSLVAPLRRVGDPGALDAPPTGGPAAPPEAEELAASLREAAAALEGADGSQEEASLEAARASLVKAVKWSVDLPVRLWGAEAGDCPAKWLEGEPDALRQGQEPPMDTELPGEGVAWKVPEYPTITLEDGDYDAFVDGLRGYGGRPKTLDLQPMTYDLPTEGAAWKLAEYPTITLEDGDYDAWANSLHPCKDDGSGEFGTGLDTSLGDAPAAWHCLPEGIISEDVVRKGRRPRYLTKNSKKKISRERMEEPPLIQKCLGDDFSPEQPLTWMREQLIPEEYSPEQAKAEWDERRRRYREEAASLFEELAKEGEPLVSWPEDRCWPQEQKTKRFRARVRRLRAMEEERKGPKGAGADDYDEAQTEAARKIQALQRGKIARKKLAKEAETKAQGAAATRIQALHRGKLARKNLANEAETKAQDAAATRIQALHRGKLARKNLANEANSTRGCRRESAAQDAAATRIQAMQRGKLARKHLAKEAESKAQDKAATRIQSMQRGKMARKHLAKEAP